MGRNAKVYLYREQTYTIETDLYNSERMDNNEYINIADKLWDYRFPFYYVDEKGRLVYLYEGGLGTGAKSVQEDILMIKNDMHPSAEEIFDTVDIINEETGEVLKTLYNVDLLGILQGIKEAMGK